MSIIAKDVFDGWWRITVNRPDRLNSFNTEMKQELLAALSEAAADSACRALLITGAGRGFCAGQDLGERDPQNNESAPSFRKTLEEFYNPLVLAIREMQKPVVCGVNGVAAGAGANLALSCDIVIAARSAKFIQAFSNIGPTPDTGGSWYLPRLIGDARARGLVLLGLPITAQQAENWGMIWRTVDDEQLCAETQNIMKTLATRPTRALAAAKVLLDRSYMHPLHDQLAAKAESQEEMGRTEDYREGVQAFLAKREPSFKGR